MLQVGPRLQAFFDEPIPTIIGTTRRDGSVHDILRLRQRRPRGDHRQK